jgi:hypothetical protein
MAPVLSQQRADRPNAESKPLSHAYERQPATIHAGYHPLQGGRPGYLALSSRLRHSPAPPMTIIGTIADTQGRPAHHPSAEAKGMTSRALAAARSCPSQPALRPAKPTYFRPCRQAAWRATTHPKHLQPTSQGFGPGVMDHRQTSVESFQISRCTLATSSFTGGEQTSTPRTWVTATPTTQTSRIPAW